MPYKMNMTCLAMIIGSQALVTTASFLELAPSTLALGTIKKVLSNSSNVVTAVATIIKLVSFVMGVREAPHTINVEIDLESGVRPPAIAIMDLGEFDTEGLIDRIQEFRLNSE
ncbi:hypothetical protein K439DRAFT_1612025 [Ramaria rubella]|nr:hypothetical protein K439DRAFT_1612025 [Ramaria rubella]